MLMANVQSSRTTAVEVPPNINWAPKIAQRIAHPLLSRKPVKTDAKLLSASPANSSRLMVLALPHAQTILRMHLVDVYQQPVKVLKNSLNQMVFVLLNAQLTKLYQAMVRNVKPPQHALISLPLLEPVSPLAQISTRMTPVILLSALRKQTYAQPTQMEMLI